MPNGVYEVRVKCAEIYFDHPGARVFDIDCEGYGAFTGIDLVRSYGMGEAADLVTIVTVTDGEFDIWFKGRVENAKCSALEILWLADGDQAHKSKSLKRVRRHEKKLKRRNKRNVRRAKKKRRKNR